MSQRKPFLLRIDPRILEALQRWADQDLRSLINEGRFREDLFYRLNVVPIRLPPLRERLEDVPDLARAFLRKAETEGLPRKTVSKEALDILKKQEWSGNVRELENLMRRLCVLCPDDVISGTVVSQELSARPTSAGGPQGAQPQRLAHAIEAHLRKEVDLLATRVEGELTELRDGMRALTRDRREGTTAVEQRVAKLEETLVRVQRELRGEVLEQAKSFIDELQHAREEFAETLERELGELEFEEQDATRSHEPREAGAAPP